jgi:predicted GIY-YIG superfamily endonuclease
MGGEISFYFELWHAITVSGFISSQTVIILFSTSAWLIRCRVEAGSTAKGTGAIFPSAYRCTKLIYYEHDRDIGAAIARETQLKKWSRAKKVELINRLNPRWRDIGDQVLGE